MRSDEQLLSDVLGDPLWHEYPGLVLRLVTTRQRRLVCGHAVRRVRPMNEWRMFHATR